MVRKLKVAVGADVGDKLGLSERLTDGILRDRVRDDGVAAERGERTGGDSQRSGQSHTKANRSYVLFHVFVTSLSNLFDGFFYAWKYGSNELG